MGSQSTPNTVSTRVATTQEPAVRNVVDIYRPANAAIKRSIAPHLPSSLLLSSASASASTCIPSIATIFDLPETTYTSRVTGKNLLLDHIPSTSGNSTPSPLIHGKKRHRGHPAELARVRKEVEYDVEVRRKEGVEGMRKVRKRVRESGGVVGRGVMRGVDYKSLLPLHYLHLSYLTAMLPLPPLPPLPPLLPIPDSLTPTLSLPPGLSIDSIQTKVLKADLTGAHITILSSRNPSLLTPSSSSSSHSSHSSHSTPIPPPTSHGISGLIIEETSNTFRIITPSSPRIRVIPKTGTLFRLSFPAYAPAPSPSSSSSSAEMEDPIDWEKHLETCPRVIVDIMGSNFAYRSAERAGRKFKQAQGGGGGSGWANEWAEGDWAGVFRGVERGLERGGVVGMKGSRGGEVEVELEKEKDERGGDVQAGMGMEVEEEAWMGNGLKCGLAVKRSNEQKQNQNQKQKEKQKTKRKRGKSRRKDPPAWGRLVVP